METIEIKIADINGTLPKKIFIQLDNGLIKSINAEDKKTLIHEESELVRTKLKRMGKL